MATTEPIKATVWEDGGAALMARVVGNSATAITQAAITSISYSVFDLSGTTPNTAITGYSAVSLTVADVVYDTLQTDARWTADSTGYNFRHDIAAAVFATGGHRYRIEYKFTPATGSVFWLVYEITAKSLRTS